MTNRKKNLKHLNYRMDRIERKCDRILSEILIIRQKITRHPDMDAVINRLHKTAREMRDQCIRERDYMRRMLKSQSFE